MPQVELLPNVLSLKWCVNKDWLRFITVNLCSSPFCPNITVTIQYTDTKTWLHHTTLLLNTLNSWSGRQCYDIWRVGGTLLDATFSTQQAWWAAKPIMLLWSRRELSPNWQPDNVQYFASKEINKPDITNVVYVLKELKTWMKKTLKNEIYIIRLTDIISNAIKQRYKEQNEQAKSEEDQNLPCGTTICWHFYRLHGLLGVSMH